MNEKHRMILEHCKNGYTSLTPLLPKIPKSSLYVYREELLKDGYLSKKKAKYKTTQKGLSELSKSQEGGEVSGTQEQHLKQETKIEQKQTTTPGLYNQIKELVGNGENVFDYNAKVMRLKDKLENISISTDNLENFIQLHNELNALGFTTETALALSKELQKTKLGVKGTVAKLGKCLCQYGNLESGITLSTKKFDELQNKIKTMEEKKSKMEGTIKNYGSTPQKVGELVELDAILRDVGITLQRAKEFAQIQSQLRKLGFDIKTTDILAKELKGTNLGLNEAIKKVAYYANTFGSLERAKQTWEQHKKESLDNLRVLSTQLSEINKKIQYGNGVYSKILNGIKELREQKDQLNNTLSIQADEIRKYKEEENIIQQNISHLLRVKNGVEEIKKGINNLETEKANIEKALESASEKHKKLIFDIQITHAWRNFLFSKTSIGVLLSGDLKCLLKIYYGEAKQLEEYKEQIAERVRKRMVEFYKKMVEKDLVSVYSRWDVERLQKEVATLQEKTQECVPKEKYKKVVKELENLKKKS